MWLMGGWITSYEDGPRDVWSSADGLQWDRTTAQAPWKHADLSTTLTFDRKLWILGGWHGGRLPHATASNQVWSSGDGKNWTETAHAARWNPRVGAAGVVFKDRMWMLGGIERYYDGAERDLRNDVWSSADGREWKQATEHAPWSPRAYHAALVFDGKIWILGGGNYLPAYKAFNDVWNSVDGVRWTEVTKDAAWAPRIWFSAVVYRDCMWVLGGWSNRPSKNWNDVWRSADGKTWKPLQTGSIWSARHEHSTFVLNDAIWVVGGNAWPLVNDVWRLKLPDGWTGSPTQSP